MHEWIAASLTGTVRSLAVASWLRIRIHAEGRGRRTSTLRCRQNLSRIVASDASGAMYVNVASIQKQFGTVHMQSKTLLTGVQMITLVWGNQK